VPDAGRSLSHCTGEFVSDFNCYGNLLHVKWFLFAFLLMLCSFSQWEVVGKIAAVEVPGMDRYVHDSHICCQTCAGLCWMSKIILWKHMVSCLRFGAFWRYLWVHFHQVHSIHSLPSPPSFDLNITSVCCWSCLCFVLVQELLWH